MGNISQHHEGAGDNVIGDKNIYNLSVGIDIGRLIEILQTDGEKIKNLLLRVQEQSQSSEIKIDDKVIAIEIKNNINDLKEYYEKFIKEDEGKLAALDNFFKEYDYMKKIEGAADALKRHIFSFQNRKTDKLDPHTFDNIIQNHCMSVSGAEDKDIMKLLLFYLYRFCYIGLKNGR